MAGARVINKLIKGKAGRAGLVAPLAYSSEERLERDGQNTMYVPLWWGRWLRRNDV